VSSPIKSNIRKKRIAHSDDRGILSTVSGYTTNASPEPTHHSISRSFYQTKMLEIISTIDVTDSMMLLFTVTRVSVSLTFNFDVVCWTKLLLSAFDCALNCYMLICTVVTDDGTNRKSICDFLLVININ